MKVYYSRMNNAPNALFMDEMNVLCGVFGKENVVFHGGGQYDALKLTTSNIVVVSSSGGEYTGKGVYSEINTALSMGKKVFQFTGKKDSLDRPTFQLVSQCIVNDPEDFKLKYGRIVYDERSSNNGMVITIASLQEINDTSYKDVSNQDIEGSWD